MVKYILIYKVYKWVQILICIKFSIKHLPMSSNAYFKIFGQEVYYIMSSNASFKIFEKIKYFENFHLFLHI